MNESIDRSIVKFIESLPTIQSSRIISNNVDDSNNKSGFILFLWTRYFIGEAADEFICYFYQ